jgi:hypothetical protein
MTAAAWNRDALAEIARHDEVRIASLRSDGTLGSSRIIWAVSLDGRVYIRSVNGPGSAWYRSTQRRHEGRLTAGSVAQDVAMHGVDDADDIQQRIDGAYRAKYAGYHGPVARITSDQARAATLELVPQ